MSRDARKNIFKRLNSVIKTDPVSTSDEKQFQQQEISQIDKIETLKSRMEAMRTEVHVVNPDNWLDTLIGILKEKELKNLLYSPDLDIGRLVKEKWEKNGENLPELIPYSENIESFKSRLFEIDASITTTRCAVADVGAIILWPDNNEPRTMSLVPPVHIAVLEKEKIYCNLSEVIIKEGWSERMPTNALLISGPSKTADIELTLAYGVHGPKQLILLIV